MKTSGRTSGLGPVADASQPKLRFAVATFDSWQQTQTALQALSEGGNTLRDISYLALDRILADLTMPEHLQTVSLFEAKYGAMSCSSGPVADRLLTRASSGAASLQAALDGWLIARHAAELEQAVEDGKILLWVQLFDSDDERRAYQSLLATSSSSVGVHDLIGK